MSPDGVDRFGLLKRLVCVVSYGMVKGKSRTDEQRISLPSFVSWQLNLFEQAVLAGL